jgi:hypothetical protein
MSNETEIIGKLFIELSQFTDAKTDRELQLEYKLANMAIHVGKLVRHIRKTEPDNAQACAVMDYMHRIKLAGIR